jgi:hypothetical protein
MSPGSTHGTRRPPATTAMWAAHAAAPPGRAPDQTETIEKVARAAISAYLRTLAEQNEIVTENRKNYVQGDDHTILYRALYPEDLRRMAEQITDQPVVGPRPAPARRGDDPGSFPPLI